MLHDSLSTRRQTSACQFIPEAVTQLHRSMPAHYDQLITDTCGGGSLFVH